MEFEAYILIGGRSSRLGQDKASLNFDGISLAERTAETIGAAISPSQIRLVAADDLQVLGFPALLKNLPVVCDLYEGRGPAGGLHAALAYAQTEWILVLGCDFPFVSVELLQRLACFVADDIEAVAPVQSDGQTQPLCTFYRRKPCLKVLTEIFDKKRPTPGLKSVLDQVLTRFVSFDELSDLPNSQNIFLNLNTPQDFDVVQKILSLK